MNNKERNFDMNEGRRQILSRNNRKMTKENLRSEFLTNFLSFPCLRCYRRHFGISIKKKCDFQIMLAIKVTTKRNRIKSLIHFSLDAFTEQNIFISVLCSASSDEGT